MIDAIVLAGSKNNGPLQECSKARNEAMIKIADKFMVEYVVESIRQCPAIGQIIIVGPVKALQNLYGDRPDIQIAAPGSNIVESLTKGIAKAGEASKRILVVVLDGAAFFSSVTIFSTTGFITSATSGAASEKLSAL